MKDYFSDEECIDDMTFDIETGERSLSKLEDKIRIFHGLEFHNV